MMGASPARMAWCSKLFKYFILTNFILAIITVYTFAQTALPYLTPNIIFEQVDSSCIVIVSEPVYLEKKFLFHSLDVAFKEESAVIIGQTDLDSFVWKSGRPLAFRDGAALSDAKEGFVVFQKRKQDRTCLLTGSLKSPPVADVFTGNLNIELSVSFINSKCDTFRTDRGSVTTEGLHRQEILRTLFSVCDVSSTNMGKLFQLGNVSSCTPESCLDDGQGEKRYHSSAIHRCEKISLPTKDDFFHNYLKISKPVIIKDAMKYWTAIKKWTNDFFRENYGDRKIHVKLTPAGEYEGVEPASLFENYDSFEIPDKVKKQLKYPDLVVVRPATANLKFSKFLDVMESVSKGDWKNMSAYLEYSSIADIMPDIQDDVEEMPFFKKLLKLEHLNIWLSDGNTLGKLHFDPYDNFLCQLSGRKQVVLFEPHDNRKLYEAHIPEAMLSYNSTTKTFHRKKLVDSTSMVMSPVDINKPDFQRFPRLAEAYPLNCTIEEGEVLFMPAFWWHEVQSFPNTEQGRNLAVNFWYDPFLTKEFPCPECGLDVNPKYRHLL